MNATQPEPLFLPDELEPDNPLWRYALLCWQNTTLAECCLALQAQGWSVTRILYAGWLGNQGQTCTEIEDAKVTEWRSCVTGTVRSIRKLVPRQHQMYQPLQQALAEAELQAEQIELAIAWQSIRHLNPAGDKTPCSSRIIRQNLQAIAPRQQPDTHCPATLDTLAHLLTATHGEPLIC